MNNQTQIMIAAVGSGSGKTTLTCGLLSYFKNKGIKLAAFKCGPDYIDPMFHEKVLGVASYNLDLFMMGEQGCRQTMAHHMEGKELAIVEGVMGFYDGVGTSTTASTYALAQTLQIPVVLVVNCKGMGLSVAAMIKGYLEFRPNTICGIILNQVSETMYVYYKKILEENLPIKVLGYMPYEANFALESRHLGLVTAAEVKDLAEKMSQLGEVLSRTIDMDALMALEVASGPETEGATRTYAKAEAKVRIGVAKDAAFCFYYADNLELLEHMGAELVYFSPLEDEHLPEHLDGLILGGGYPELYLKQLHDNHRMRKAIKAALLGGIPCIAECGGFMYLGRSISGYAGETYQMVGFLEGEAVMTHTLGHFGYVTLHCKQNNLLGQVGETILAHEFHYAKSSHEGESYLAKKPLSPRNWQGIVATDHLFAGYPHVHWIGQEHLAERFIAACHMYKMKSV